MVLTTISFSQQQLKIRVAFSLFAQNQINLQLCKIFNRYKEEII